MSEEHLQDMETQPEELLNTPYRPRPLWQRIAAWIGIAIVVAGVILYYYHIARGGR